MLFEVIWQLSYPLRSVIRNHLRLRHHLGNLTLSPVKRSQVIIHRSTCPSITILFSSILSSCRCRRSEGILYFALLVSIVSETTMTSSSKSSLAYVLKVMKVAMKIPKPRERSNVFERSKETTLIWKWFVHIFEKFEPPWFLSHYCSLLLFFFFSLFFIVCCTYGCSMYLCFSLLVLLFLLIHSFNITQHNK